MWGGPPREHCLRCQDLAFAPTPEVQDPKMPPASRHRSEMVLPYKSMKSNPADVALCTAEASFPETLTWQLSACLEPP